jgi:spore maturation protein CgeB
MNALVVLTKVNQIFENSFLEAAAANGISLYFFYVDENLNRQLSVWREQVKRMIREQAIEKILVINDYSSGKEYLIDDSIFALVPCNVWFVDPLQLDAYATTNRLKQYSHIFSYEPTDIPYCIKKFNIIADYLPFPAGESLFCSNPRDFKEKEEYDISFVGLVGKNQRRLQVLEAAVRICRQRHYTMALYGQFWNDSHWLVSKTSALKFRKKYPELYPFVHNYRLSPTEVSALYRKTRINLNIHYSDFRTGASPRTFEIMGNNNFELCDARDFSCTNLVPGQHLAVYHDIEEMEQLLVYYLEHDRERIQIAKNGGKAVREQYMFSHVITKVLA